MGFDNNASIQSADLAAAGAVTVAQAAALAGTDGTPGAGNKYVTDSDPRLLAPSISVSLTAAEIKALRATPKTLLVAQGTNNWIQVVSVVIYLKFGTIAFTGIGTLQLKYTDGSGPSILDTAIPATAFVIGADHITPAVSANQGFVAANAINKAVVLHNIGAAEFLAGDGTAKVKFTYRVHDLS